VKRILKSAVFVLATVYFIVDAAFLTIATPLARWMARQRVFVRLRKWIGSLGPYPSLALFAATHRSRTGEAGRSLFNRYEPNRGGDNDARCRRITKTGHRRALIQTLPPQAPENPDFCLGLRTLAAGRRLACLHESLASRPTMDFEGQAALAQFPYASELVIEVSASFCAFSMTDIRLRKAREPEDPAALLRLFHSGARGEMNRADHSVGQYCTDAVHEIGEPEKSMRCLDRDSWRKRKQTKWDLSP
jgi:hypothetical protein